MQSATRGTKQSRDAGVQYTKAFNDSKYVILQLLETRTAWANVTRICKQEV